jgi:uncharacterized membrane protein YedE/YeeE
MLRGKEFGPFAEGVAMNAIFWAGLVLGAVAGLAVDLWKRPLDRLLDRRLENRTTTRATEISKRLATDRQGLRDFLMVQILETTLIGSLAAIISGLLFTAPSIVFSATTSPDVSIQRIGMVFSVLGQVIAVAAAGMVVRIASDAISVARKVAEFRVADSIGESAANDADP